MATKRKTAPQALTTCLTPEIEQCIRDIRACLLHANAFNDGTIDLDRAIELVRAAKQRAEWIASACDSRISVLEECV